MNVISARYIPMLANFLSKPLFVPHALGGLRIEPAPCGGVYLVATNGYAMVVIHDSEANHGGEAITVPLSPLLVQQAKRAGTARFDGARCELFTAAPGKGKPVEFIVAVPAKQLSGKFPNWRSVLPTKETPFQYGPAAINSAFLRMLSTVPKCAEQFTPTHYGVPVLHVGSNRTVVARFLRLPQIVAVLMPVRGIDMLPGFDADWIGTSEAEAAETQATP